MAIGNTILAYRGASVVDCEVSIDLVISGIKRPSKNAKTGPMVQTSVFCTGIAPNVAQKTGADVATCNNCPLRPQNARHCRHCGEINSVGKLVCVGCGGDLGACYVKTFQGELAKWKASRSLDVTPLDDVLTALDGRSVRFGSYGNQSNVPRVVLEPILSAPRRHTMYDQQWRNPDHRWIRQFAMASVGSAAERTEAMDLGFRTFRRLYPGDSLESGEILCPHYTHGVHCIDCGLCSGASVAKTIAHPIHR